MDELTFILASQSPRRRQLLELFGYPIEVFVSGVDEESGDFDGPADYVAKIARRKAEAIAAAYGPPQSPRCVLVAADTTVSLDGRILGKPTSHDDARRMLGDLRGRVHEVHTGLCLIDLGTAAEYVGVHTAHVTMRPYATAEIEAYVATGDPMDKAGAYAIQHPEFRPVASLSGCFLGVMGLSLCHLIEALTEMGLPIAYDRGALQSAHNGYPCPLLGRLRAR